MANYQETEDYFKMLCMLHTSIVHTDPNPKFFRMDMEEFISGSIRKLPTDAYFMVLINYIMDLDTPHSQEMETQQIMFYVMRHAKKDDFDANSTARIQTEEIIKDMLDRMQYDSLNGHAFFEGSFDKKKRFRRVPMEINTPSGRFVGWQCSLYLERHNTRCFDTTKWIDLLD